MQFLFDRSRSDILATGLIASAQHKQFTDFGERKAALLGVLDEMDAALDEANVYRFRSMLESLIDTTQFIVITHNRRTVEAAKTIYGISMGSDSASIALSLKIDEAEARLRKD